MSHLGLEPYLTFKGPEKQMTKSMSQNFRDCYVQALSCGESKIQRANSVAPNDYQSTAGIMSYCRYPVTQGEMSLIQGWIK